ncbi:MAG: aminotransferase [Myxococcales bacterium]|nr:aminotransferase [Myxococcales bacterium]|tara:strand:- start:891 stop:2078 length:1188 start_codon:yes stop_codon:yes gene_type:complete
MPSRYARHWTLNPKVTFLNHGSYGACPKEVLAYQQELRQTIEEQPVQFFMRDIYGHIDDARKTLAQFVKARAQDLVFIRNTTEGVNSIIRSFGFTPGDEILVTNHGYNACKNIVDFVAQKTGARVVVAEFGFEGINSEHVIEAIWTSVSPKTRLAIIDHVTSPTGLVLPVKKMAEKLERSGVRVLIDGAHGPGMLDLSMPDLSASWYVGNLHKWVCAPKGAAFMWMREDVQSKTRPAVISHGFGLDANELDRPWHHLEFDWVGTQDPTAWLSVPKAIDVLDKMVDGGWDVIRQRNRTLALEAQHRLSMALERDKPVPDAMIGHLAAVKLPSSNRPISPLFGTEYQQILLDQFGIEVPVIPWPGPSDRLLRISAALHNDSDDYIVLSDAIGKVLPC